MKHFITIIALLALTCGIALGQGGIVPSNATAANLNTNGAVGPAGALSSPSGLLLNVTGGPVFCSGSNALLAASQFTLVANTTYNVGMSCAFEQPFVRIACTTANAPTGTIPGINSPCVNNPIGPNEILLGTATTGATTVSGTTDSRSTANFPLVTDGTFEVPLGACSLTATVGAFAANSATTGGLTAPAVFRVAAGNNVLQAVTSAATNTLTLDCDILPPSKLTANKGAVINNIQLFYGVQTTALTSITAPVVNTVTYPATGAAAASTVAAGGGALTVTPGSLQLTTTTSGQCFSENIALGTPISVVTDLQRITLEQQFLQSAASVTTLQICGVLVHYTIPVWY